jgi:hypothetical protein
VKIQSFVLACTILAFSFGARTQAQCNQFAAGFGLPGSGLTGVTQSLCVYDDGSGANLYAGGYFNNYSQAHVVRWNGSTWSIAAHANGFGQVYALLAWNDGSGEKLYAAGQFLTFDNTVSAKNIACWNGTNWAPLGQGTDSAVYALAVFDDGSGPKLYAGGAFSNAGGAPAARVAKWDGSQWSAVGSNLPGTVKSLAGYDSGSGPQLYAGGYFGLRKFDGATWSMVGGNVTGPNLSVEALVVHDDGSGSGTTLFVGGRFEYANGLITRNLVRWNGTQWIRLAAEPDDVVYSLRVHDDGTGTRLYAGGQFDSVQLPYSQLWSVGAWDGHAWSALSTGIQPNYSPVYALQNFDDGYGNRLYLGGVFTSAGAIPSRNIARWGDACTPPIISQQPQSFTATFDGSSAPIVFHVEATGAAPMSYQWRRDGIALANSLSHLDGATTSTLRIYSSNYGDHGDYDCVITNPLGVATSDVATLTVPLGPSGYPVQITRVLTPPEQVPNLPTGALFTTFEAPAQSSTGDVVFEADIVGDSLGRSSVDLWQNGIAGVVHREREQAPGCEGGCTFDAAGTSSSPFRNLRAAANGCLAFWSELDHYSLPDGREGIWYRDASATTLVARVGSPAVGGQPNEVWKALSAPAVSDNGRLAFSGYFYVAPTVHAVGAWSWDSSNGAQLMMRNGQPAIGINATLTSFLMPGPLMNSAGEVLVAGQLNTQTGFSYNQYPFDTAIWFGQPNSLQPIAKSGDPAPGFGASDNLERAEWFAVSKTGEVVFSTGIAGPSGFQSQALYRYASGTLSLLAARGDAVPDAPAGVQFFYFRPIAANASGDVLIDAVLSSSCSPCPSFGLFLWHAGSWHKVATNRMDPLVGLPSVFVLEHFDSAGLDAAGDVVFDCTVAYGAQFGATYGWNVDQGLFPIIAPGAQLEVAPGQFRTARGSTLARAEGTSNSQIPVASITDDGRVVVQLGFTDGSMGMWSGQFLYFQGLQFGPGQPYCFGDGQGSPCPCNNVGGAGEGCRNSTGSGAVLSASGTVSVALDNLRFDTAHLPAHVSAILYEGALALGGGLGLPFKDGLKCAGGTPTRRFALQSTDAAGHASWGPGLAGPAGWTAGSTRYFQVWYRDAAGTPCGLASNLSNATRVTFTE